MRKKWKGKRILSLLLAAMLLLTCAAPSQTVSAAGQVTDPIQNPTDQPQTGEGISGSTEGGVQGSDGKSEGEEGTPKDELGGVSPDENGTAGNPGTGSGPAAGDGVTDVPGADQSQGTPVPTDVETPAPGQATQAPDGQLPQGTPEGTPGAASPLPGTVQSSNAALAPRAEGTHIATYVGQVPQIDGVTWAADVTTETFNTAYQTVKVSDTNNTEYTVEVVPENLVYFIDSYNFAADTVSEPYEAVKALVGEGLLNDQYDQQKTDDNTWGLVGAFSAKGNLTVTDKDTTGIYGTPNAKGTTLVYVFTLPAGKYTITTMHKEWWDGPRPMSLSVAGADGTALQSGSVEVSKSKPLQSWNGQFSISKAQEVTFTATATGTEAPAISWLAIVQDEAYQELQPGQEPPRPTDKLPAGYDKPLEDNDGLTLAAGTENAITLVSGFQNMFNVNVQWNNANQYHASVTEAKSLFGKTAFTVLLDVKQSAPSGDPSNVDNRVALTIGNATNSLHLLTWSGKFGYGGKGGISDHLVPMTDVEQGGWNALAMTYEEKADGKTAVTVYANGHESVTVEDVGFKLSEMTDLTSMLARTFGTNYLQEGVYDNLVVFDGVVDGTVLCQETLWRKWKKENPGMNTLELEKAIADAEALIAAGITSDELTAALDAAKALLTSDDQDAINAGAAALKKVLASLTPTEIVLRGSDVEAAVAKPNGLAYKGFGMLNGNSTSNLLLDYKAENETKYWEMMEFLFGGDYPLFTHIKMEMGNDGNNSTGAEACTMRSADDKADASRSPGFVMAADAKKINPDVKVSILRWCYPNWVRDAGFRENSSTEDGYEEMYIWYRDTIFDAYKKYGYMVDFVNPDRNETGNPDEKFIKWYKARILAEDDFPADMPQPARDAYKSIRIIASDENKGLQVVPSMRNDTDFYNTVDIIGFHYRTDATDDYVRMADEDNKEVWYSEGCATFGYTELQETKTSAYGYRSIGGYQSPLALMDSFITAFDASRRTHYIFQPAIGSFYEGIQYGHKELLSARDPWSGYIHYDPALYMLEHFAKFAKLGWEDGNQTKGIWRAISQSSKGAFAGSSNEHATAGIDGNAGYLTLAAPDKSDFTVVFVNNTQNAKSFCIKAEDMAVGADQALQKWVTETSDDTTNRYMQDGGTIECVNGSWLVTLPAYSVVTATTLTKAEASPLRAPSERIHNGDRTVLDSGLTGRGQDTANDVLYADDFNYTDEPDMKQYNRVTDAETEVPYIDARGGEPRYMLDTHGAWIVEDKRLTQKLGSAVDQWNGGEPSTIVGDFRWMDYSAEIKVQIPDAAGNVWACLGIRTQTGMNWNQSGYTLRMYGNGKWELFRVGTKVSEGNVDASADGSYTLFLMGLGDTVTAAVDGKVVATYQDANPMLSGRVKISSSWNQVYFDDFVVKKVSGGIPYALSMVDGQDPGVSYEGAWKIEQPGGGSADNWYRTVSQGGENASLSFKVTGDGFSIIGENGAGVKLDIYVDNALKAENVAVTAVPKRYEAYTVSGLGMGEHDIKVVVKEGTLTVDALYGLAERSTADNDAVAEVLTKLPLMAVAAEEAAQAADSLPAQVKVRTVGGTEKDLDVVWEVPDPDVLTGKLFQRTSIAGTVQGAQNVAGLDVVVSVPVEVVSKDTLYYIDTVTGFGADDAEVTETESHTAVKALLGTKLLNQTYDQLKTADNTWGLVDQDAGTKGFTSTEDKFATGIYGADNKTGETLSYDLTLPAGSYTLYSGHSEWWGMNRPMTASLTIGGGKTDAGSIALSGSNNNLVNVANFTVAEDGVVTYTLTATGTQAPVISWLAVVNREPDQEPERPIATLPEGYDEPLEDNDKLGLTTGAKLTPVTGFGNVLDLSSGWDNQNNNHAYVKDAKGYFKTAAFTVLLDVRRDGASGDATTNDKSTAMSIGESGNTLRLLTRSNKFGYGGDKSGANMGGLSENYIDLEGLEESGWNSIAMTYQEKDGANGSVIIYANGQKAGEVADIGFKLSQLENLEAMVGRSFNTSFMPTGRYDNIVVFGSVLDEETACAETAWRRWRQQNPPSPNDTEALKTELQALIKRIRNKLEEDKEAGITYAEEPLKPGQYTGAGEAPKDNLQDLNLAITRGNGLLQDADVTSDALQECIDLLREISGNLRTLSEPYTSIPGQKGSVILADTGLPMQAHGGSAILLKEGTGEGCVNFDLDGDGQITPGKEVYLWYGENKTNNTHPVDGVRCYASTDLYNWTDRGNVLYLQNAILPIEESGEKAVTNPGSAPGASGEGDTQNYNAMQLSQTNLETLKAWGKLETAPAGVSEEDFGNVKLFLRAYVTEFDKAPTGLYDTAWTAKTYDETPITASSFLYPDSKTQGTVQTTPLQLAFEGLYGDYCITERPKMIYNESKGKFVIVFHADGVLYNNEALNSWVAGGCEGNCSASRYSRAMVGFAESDTPFGPFKLVNMTRMNYDTSLHASRLGESRDMTVFVDKGVDSNGDNVDDAYVVYSSEMNAKLYVSLLNADYTAPIAPGDTAEVGKEAAYRIVGDNSREAPAIMKYDGWYYLITSGTDGWNSTAHTYYRSQNMLSGWEKVGNPALNDTGKCFDTQVTYVLPVDAENGKFIYMGDRWNGSNLTDSRTIWMPIQMGADHTVSILGESDWTVDRLNSLTPVKINTKLPDVVCADGSNLPEELNVTVEGKTADYAVTWNLSKVNMGDTVLTGTLPDCNNLEVRFEAFVAPKNLIFFANCSNTEQAAGEDYTKIVLLNNLSLAEGGAGDGAYSKEEKFGYTGEAGKVRNTNEDIYQSMRYAEAGNSITYQFDLPSDGGEYKVYAGMYDPSGWYSEHKGTRYADISINGEIVTTKYQYLNGTNDTLVYQGVTPDENGILTVTVAKNADSTKDVQLSFLMVEKVEGGVTPTPTVSPEVTESPAPTVSPEVTESPKPEETGTPAPEVTQTPAPEETETPVPEETTTPAPEATQTPAPEETETPAPEATQTPAPEETETPAPEETTTPAPEETTTPAPEETQTPAPEATQTPAPEETETPAPGATQTPAPEETETPAPEATQTPKPEGTATPAPEATGTPKPGTTATPAPTATPIVIPGGEKLEVVQTTDAPKTEVIANVEAVTNTLKKDHYLTEEEKEDIDTKGAGLEVVMKVKDVSVSVPKQDKDAIADNEQTKKYLDESKPAQYLDISMSVKVTQQGVVITERQLESVELDSPVRVDITIPEKMREGYDPAKYDRFVVVIRVHNGEAEIVAKTSVENQVVSFTTDKFSTYLMTVADEQKAELNPSPAPTQGPASDNGEGSDTKTDEKTNAPKTGDFMQASAVVWFIVLTMAGIGAAIVVKRRRESE